MAGFALFKRKNGGKTLVFPPCPFSAFETYSWGVAPHPTRETFLKKSFSGLFKKLILDNRNAVAEHLTVHYSLCTVNCKKHLI